MLANSLEQWADSTSHIQEIVQTLQPIDYVICRTSDKLSDVVGFASPILKPSLALHNELACKASTIPAPEDAHSFIKK